MRYTAVLNGCCETYRRQSEELLGFISANLPALQGSAVILYDREERKEFLAAHAPSEDIIMVQVSRYQADIMVSILHKILRQEDSDLYLFPGDTAGSELSVRLSWRLGGSVLTGVDSLVCKKDMLLCRKTVYSGNLKGSFSLHDRPFFISTAPGCERIQSPENWNRSIRDIDAGEGPMTHVREYHIREAEKSTSLVSAACITAAGRGAGSGENMSWIREQAFLMGSEFGVTRTAAMNGWAPVNRIIGVSGTVTNPEVCIVLGASGAAAFFAGIEKSKFIISVNKDKNAPIVSRSDAAVIDDCCNFMEALMKIIRTGGKQEQ